MFTGFTSENTPAIQVWDFSNAFGTSTANRNIALTDDCAPIQVILTGGSVSGAINVILPNAPIEGKQIKIINASYGADNSGVSIKSADFSSFGTSANVAQLGTSQTIDLCYSKYFISNAISSAKTGWISLNQAAVSSPARNSVAFGELVSARGNSSAAIGGSFNTANALYSSLIGGSSNTASGDRAAVVGGASNTASGSSAAVVGGSSNTASGNSAAVVGGASNSATSFYAVVVGSDNSGATGSNSAVIGGSTNTASGPESIVAGSGNSTANGQNSAVLGGRYGSTRLIGGNAVFPANVNPIASSVGVSQSATLLLARQTTDATATRLTSNTSAAGTTNQVILPNNSAYTFQGTCIANVTGGGTTSGWKFEGVIKRGANAASTALVAAVTPLVIAQDAGAATWVLAVTADTTNGSIAVTVTGAAATTIRWVAKIETTEVTF